MKVNIGPYTDNPEDRVVEVHIDEYDAFNLDDTLSLIIGPGLTMLKKVKIGSGYVDDEDVPADILPLDVHKRWEWVLNEMEWAFNTHAKDWEKPFYSETPSGASKFDHEAAKACKARMLNGFRLFGKYYFSLWD